MKKELTNKLVTRWLWMSIMLYLINVIVLPVLEQMPITSEKAVIGIPIAVFGGLAFAYFMNLFEQKN